MSAKPAPAAARQAAVLALALAIDRALGDPPTALHPVGWMGRAAEALRRRAPASPAGRLRFGAAAAGGLPLGAAAAYALAGGLARRFPGPLALTAEAALLSSTFALGTLLRRAREVEDALDAGDVEGARRLVGYHLVSRDTGGLAPDELAAATIESLAENLGDGFVAPLLAWALGGLPAAAAYRAVNTLDSLWGYRTPEFIALGRHPARLDDALNLVPSRVSAGAIVAASALLAAEGHDARRAFDTWLDEGDFTPSPNAGQPMGAMAGALGVELAKDGEYRLGKGLPRPGVDDIARARRLVAVAAGLVAGGVALAVLLRGFARGRA